MSLEERDDWQEVSFLLLPRQAASLERLAGHLGVQPRTAIMMLARIATGLVTLIEERDDETEWIDIASVFETDAIPAAVGRVVREAMTKRISEGKGGGQHLWLHLEAWAAEELAS